MNLFDEITEGVNLHDPKFDQTRKVHDWRNYVPFEWQKDWNEFTDREKKIIIVMAETQAEVEEWD